MPPIHVSSFRLNGEPDGHMIWHRPSCHSFESIDAVNRCCLLGQHREAGKHVFIVSSDKILEFIIIYLFVEDRNEYNRHVPFPSQAHCIQAIHSLPCQSNHPRLRSDSTASRLRIQTLISIVKRICQLHDALQQPRILIVGKLAPGSPSLAPKTPKQLTHDRDTHGACLWKMTRPEVFTDHLSGAQ